MNDNPTDILKKEHEKVLEILNRLETGIENRDAELLTENISILEKEFDKHSLNKEEKALFLEIEKIIPREDGPTGVMVMEHKELTELIKSFKDVLGINDFEKLNEIGKNIFSILRPHIDKENSMLFMIADMHLDDEQKKTITEKFKEIDLVNRD
ncbi:MAG: hemerythrin domain-containing protein [Patescibacteria group bacterium]